MATEKTTPYNLEAANRLMIFRTKYIDKSQTKAAKKLKIPQSMLSKMENGLSVISVEFVDQLRSEYGLNSDWLASNEGSEIDKNPPANATLKTITALRHEVVSLKKSIKIFEINQSHLTKQIELLLKRVGNLEDRSLSK